MKNLNDLQCIFIIILFLTFREAALEKMTTNSEEVQEASVRTEDWNKRRLPHEKTENGNDKYEQDNPINSQKTLNNKAGSSSEQETLTSLSYNDESQDSVCSESQKSLRKEGNLILENEEIQSMNLTSSIEPCSIICKDNKIYSSVNAI